MKVVILAGGRGTRLSEETTLKPKPMIEIGGKPIIWHIMKMYSSYGFNEFILCCGYKSFMIKEYFANYSLHMSDITFDFDNNSTIIHENLTEPWKVTLVDTGLDTMTGGRLKRVKKYIGEETFCFTYGDGVSNVNFNDLIKFHRSKKVLATLTAVQPVGRFGRLTINKNMVSNFEEKPDGDEGWINGGFFVLEPEVIDLIDNDLTIWEREPLVTLAKKSQLAAYNHKGFWEAMDTMRDKEYLEQYCNSGVPPWFKPYE
jgi:glucose-1-phosphate cytidylyltransferase